MRIATLLTTGLISLTLGGTAFAAPEGKRAGFDRNEPTTRAQMLASVNTRFDGIDTNKDGVIDAAEMEAAKAAMQQRRAKWREARAARAETAGTDANKPAMRERRGKRMGADGQRGQRGMGLARLDTNGDGTISRAEFAAPAMQRFDRADADGDGVVTPAERAAMREARKAARS